MIRIDNVGRRWSASVALCWLAGLLALAGVLPAAAQTCGAAGGDNRPALKSDCTDTAAEPASHPGQGPATGTANSVDIITGNKYLRDTDASWPDGLLLRRHYNSRNDFTRSLGPGWSHSYDTALVRVRRPATRGRDQTTELQVIQADGRRLVFRGVRERGGPGASRRVIRFRAVDPAYGSITEQPDGSGGAQRYRWRWRNGQVLSFDELGRLTAIHTPDGERYALHHDGPGGRLARVVSRAGLQLRFDYQPDAGQSAAGQAGTSLSPAAAAPLLRAVLLPDGQRVSYLYDSAGQLAQVRHPSGEHVSYRYDDPLNPLALTSLADARGRSRGEFRYDSQGRAVYSALAGGVEAIWLAWQPPPLPAAPGNTTVVNSLGQSTRYQWRYRMHDHRGIIESASGPGCAACPPSDVERIHDADWRLVQQRQPGSIARMLYDHDPAGRLVGLRRSGPGSGAAWLVRYRYASDDIDAPLVSIAWPSVAPGRLHERLLRRDGQGRVVEVIERGFAPDLSSLGPALLARRWLPVERRTRLTWSDRAEDQDRLLMVDGPLPGSEDTIVFNYDRQGRRVAVRLPGALAETDELDRYGRVVAHTDSAGRVTRFDYDLTGSVSAISRGGERVSVDYGGDPLRPVVSLPGRGRLAFEFDAAGRWLSATDETGGRIETVYDTENQRLATRLLAGAGRGPQLLVEQRPGGPLPPPASTDWDGQRALVLGLPGGRRVWMLAGQPRGFELRDDFGQLQAQAGVEHGVTVHRYDAAGRRIASIGERGVLLQRYDAAGRLLAQGTPANPLAVQYRYDGNRLLSVSGPQQTTAYGHDDLGRLVAQAVLVGPREGPASQRHLFVTLRHYDRFGRLAALTLPNGFVLGYGYQGNGQLSAIVLRDGAAPGAGAMSGAGTGIAAARLIASDIRWLPFAAPGRGLLGLESGNGIRVDYQHDRAGRIELVRHSPADRSRQREAADPLPQLRVSYDANGRVQAIDHGASQHAYAYDQAGRLAGTAAIAREAGSEPRLHYAEGYGYDAFGNRLVTASAAGGSLMPVAQSAGAGASLRFTLRRHQYARSGRDLGLGDMQPPRIVRTAAAQSAPGPDRFDHLGRRLQHPQPGDAAASRIFLYADGLVSGEADQSGRLLRWYLYLGSRPVAMLDFSRLPQGEVFHLHTDHLGSFQAATDQHGQVRLQAQYRPFGRATLSMPASASASASNPQAGMPAPFVPLRLPGQYADDDTGLHHNLFRQYDPDTGRYTTPDPMGMVAGSNAYAYAGLDPAGRIDPTGLYQTDVHYYMMFFLARVSGLSPQASLTIAQASQYVDDNPATEPIPAFSSLADRERYIELPNHRLRLTTYHFTQARFDPPQRDGEANDAYARRRILSPANPGLQTLLDASRRNLRTSENPNGVAPCTRAQLFGEYLHTLADTFAHRDSNNEPIPLNAGLGHLFLDTAPDYTFNTFLGQDPANNFTYNEYRTLAMESQVMAAIQREFGTVGQDARGFPISFADLRATLQNFNATREAAGCDQANCWATKIAILDAKLGEFGLGSIPAYDQGAASQARQQNLRGLRPSNYPGVILGR